MFRLSGLNETILIIEHNIEFIAKVADYLVDLGTIAGDKGGVTLLQGTPSEVIDDDNSSWKGFKEYLKIN